MTEQEMGKILFETRKRIGLSRETVAQKANVSRSAMRNLEKGLGSSVKTLLPVLDVLGLTIEPKFDVSDYTNKLSPVERLRSATNG
ncbi:MAG: helix-turn-helix domain-containing protein [Candidatus Ancillula sp.]|jgi:transcriptional regulator with XRE-family HTH domain|nr:helix-turn-helix domain-containing protein [Candidatus Ancillula sp.]